MLIFLGFLAAFSVKVPMWPVHTWLPDVHLDGPTGAAVMLGMLKIGGYGLLRFALPITPQASHFFAPAMITLSLVAVIYSSLLALVQTDIRRLLAYSSDRRTWASSRWACSSSIRSARKARSCR